MNESPVYRVWLGWRRPEFRTAATGWPQFRQILSEQFLPKTWQVMTRFGLRAYAPTLLSAGQPADWPCEVALLAYDSVQAYDQHRQDPDGLAYSESHAQYFNFEGTTQKSRSNWARDWGTPGKPNKLDVFGWPARTPGLTLDRGSSQQVFMLLTHDEASACPPDALQAALAPLGGEVVICPQANFSLVWLAVTPDTPLSAVYPLLATGFAGLRICVLHQALAVESTGPEPSAAAATGPVDLNDLSTRRFTRC